MPNVKNHVSPLPGSLGCNPLSLAALSAATALPGTAFTTLLEAVDGKAPAWARLLQAGENRTRDGRGPFTVADPARVVQASAEYSAGIDLLVDYEHQFDRAADNGKPAPAAGWIKQFAAAGPAGEPGIWARIDWNAPAAAGIVAKEFRYLSAVIAHDAQNVVQFVARAALTNQPALGGTALFSLKQPPETNVNLLQQLLALLGIANGTADANEAGAIARVKLLCTFGDGLAKLMGMDVSALAALSAAEIGATLSKPLADKIALLATEAKLQPSATPAEIIAALGARTVDPAKFIPIEVYNETKAALSALQGNTVDRLIEEASKEGKLKPTMVPWARTLTEAQLSAWVKDAPVLVKTAPLAAPTPATATRDAADVVTLSAADEAIGRSMGLSLDAMRASKAELAGRQAA